MTDRITITSLKHLTESKEIECKQAAGKDGNGAVPDDMWATYSAMANTNGGVILLGVREKNGAFIASGINDIEKVKKDLFNTLNNPQKISVNLISDNDVSIISIDEKNIIQITVSQANRKQRPVYLNSNPMTGTYIRLHEGDRKCTPDAVKIMLAEQMTDTLDDRIFEGFTIDDLDKGSIQIFRTLFATSKPNHIWLELNDFEFIKAIRGWRKDRKTNLEGLTLAGLLMFGKWEALQDALPHYFIEYQEQDGSDRWVDRIVPDGTWTGNIFEFYRKVYRKLTEDLKIPFNLSNGLRSDDSPVHVAIREALVNALVHADYNGHSPIKIVKLNGMFSFRNPGTMRVPFTIAKSGGESDCRNKNIHQMFLLIGLGERAGSGLPKIFSGWKSQHWTEPKLIENFEVGNTTLELKTENLIPQSTLTDLRDMFGEKFESLSELERLILATAAEEKIVSHEKIKELTIENTRIITLALSKLVRLKFLKSDGVQKDKRYFLPTYTPVSPESNLGYELLQIGFIHPPEDFKYDGDIAARTFDITKKFTAPLTRKQCCEQVLNMSYLGNLLKGSIKKTTKDIEVITKILSSRNTHSKSTEIHIKSIDLSTKHNSDLSTERSTDLSTEHSTDPSTEHSTDPSTEHSTDPSTERSKDPSTERSTYLSTERSTYLSTERSTYLSTERSTDPSTERSTDPSTERSTDPSTERSTDPSTERSKDPSTERSKDPSTERSKDLSTERSKDLSTERKVRTDKRSSSEEELYEKFEKMPSEHLESLLLENNNQLADLEKRYVDFVCDEDGKPQTLYQMICSKPFTYEIPNPDKEVTTYGEYWKVYQEVVWQELLDIAEPIRMGNKRKEKKSRLMGFIIMLSIRGYLSVRDYSELLGRNPNSLRRDYLTPLVKEGVLELAYPTKPTHALQGYKTNLFKMDADLSKYDEK
ncbi:hypothetical protein IGX89_002942 [Escherichia coli]|nr:hypothetical protein [Escherichia coli]